MGGGLSRDIPEESGNVDLKIGWVDTTRQVVKGSSLTTQALILEIITRI